MNLIGLMKYLREEGFAFHFVETRYPEVDYYNAEVYLKGSLSIESEVKIFDGEKIEGMIEMEVEGAKYINLFTLDLLVETYQDYANGSDSILDIDVAEKIINYRVNDA
jgi:hypothetical protein